MHVDELSSERESETRRAGIVCAERVEHHRELLGCWSRSRVAHVNLDGTTGTPCRNADALVPGCALEGGGEERLEHLPESGLVTVNASDIAVDRDVDRDARL